MNTYLLGGGSLLLAGYSIRAWYQERTTLALLFLMGAALLVRLLMADLDPFLHDWDERFHAVVARNMLCAPFQPMLRAEPLLPYDYHAWCCNHIWLHKQPLFMWLMALSMKVFGVNTLALRLPSAVLGSLLLWPVYRLGLLALGDALAGYLGAVLVAFAYYQLELVSGAIGMDHNDVAFLVFVTGSIWAYYEYRVSERPGRWLVLVGLLAGAAVLCKWLAGLLVYGGWGLDVLLHLRRRRILSQLGHMLASVAVAVAVLLPWQLYTAWRFPRESAWESAYNARHFTEALEGHEQPWDYFFGLLPLQYGWGLLALMVLGIGLGLRRNTARRVLPLLAMIVVVFAIFTLAATKMPSYTYVVSPLLLLLAALPLAVAARQLEHWLGRWLAGTPWRGVMLAGLALLPVVVADLQPWGIVAYHRQEQAYGVLTEPLHWAQRANNAAAYSRLARELPEGYAVLNVPYGDELETMFYTGHAVYPGTLSEETVRQLRSRGIKLAAYSGLLSETIPPYLAQPDLLPLWGSLQPH